MTFKKIKTLSTASMKLSISIIPLLICLPTYAQVTLSNRSLVTPDTSILFQHMENSIKVLGTNRKVHMVSQNGTGIAVHDSNTFVIRPNTLKPDTLLVYAGKKLLLKQVFIIDTVPEPSLQLGNIESDTATINEIMANKVVRAVLKGSLYAFPVRIISFSTTCIGPAGETPDKAIAVQGNLLSPQQEDRIKQLKKNSKILFDDILAVTPDGRTRRLSPFAITIR